ncbi:hypothetical protein [Streptomyces sp. STR69]|uniref:hypothetical protein n=1 Tax=Streptomyces sp. STR69 TaxID=1796942 RepID=UPI0021C7AB4E|nr:hypothetical protein [Streptomyces sp. STR69]
MPAPELEPAFGYLRVHDASSEEVALLEKQLKEYAEAHNLKLRQIYRERHSALRVGGLGDWLVEGGVQHLIVPSMDHVSEHPIARLVFYEAVCLDARAEVHEACTKP